MTTTPTYNGKLTPQDLARIHTTRDQWMHTGLSTERCNRPKAEAAVTAAYQAAGLEPPKIVLWMDSPLGGALATAVVKDLAKKTDGDQLGGQLGGQLWGQLRGQLGGQLRGQLGDQLRDQLGDQLRGQLTYGQTLDPWYEAYWLAFYTCALPIAELDRSPRLEALNEAVQETGWWWPMQGAVVLTDRPTIITRDQQGRLHNETGPALAYTDGYELHSWHGITVPNDFHTWDTERALSEKNTEIRRCAIERLGWDTLTDRLTLIAEADDPGNPPHTIRLYDLPNGMADLYEEPARILVVHNASLDKGGHRRTFGLPVPANHTDPIAAAAALFDIPTAAYKNLARAS